MNEISLVIVFVSILVVLFIRVMINDFYNIKKTKKYLICEQIEKSCFKIKKEK